MGLEYGEHCHDIPFPKQDQPHCLGHLSRGETVIENSLHYLLHRLPVLTNSVVVKVPPALEYLGTPTTFKSFPYLFTFLQYSR